jgi:hypothetical protein
MSSICNDLAHIVEVVNEFLYFLGPELKTVTGDVQGIDAIVHVRTTTTFFSIQYPQILKQNNNHSSSLINRPKHL